MKKFGLALAFLSLALITSMPPVYAQEEEQTAAGGYVSTLTVDDCTINMVVYRATGKSITLCVNDVIAELGSVYSETIVSDNIIDSYNEVMKNSIARMPDLTTSNRRLWINYNSDNISYYIKSTGAGVS